MPAPHPIARRIHDQVLGNLATALLKTEFCEQLGRLGREDEILDTLCELRATLEHTVGELRSIMADLRIASGDNGSLNNQAA